MKIAQIQDSEPSHIGLGRRRLFANSPALNLHACMQACYSALGL